MTQQATVFLLDSMRDSFLFYGNVQAAVAKLRDQYNTMIHVDVKHLGEDACEELFELTNNPFKQECRDARYGKYRSVSVGDMCMVPHADGTSRLYACAPSGWVEVI